MVTVSVDGSVLDRIAKIMTYLRLGSSGKVLKKKKKERDLKGRLLQNENKCYGEQKNLLGKDMRKYAKVICLEELEVFIFSNTEVATFPMDA
jgi:hypothetical protein